MVERMIDNGSSDVVNGAYCNVVAGTHAGKSGIISDMNTSKLGHVTITVMQESGVRFKTLARSVVVVERT